MSYKISLSILNLKQLGFMQYISTRDNRTKEGFADVVTQGLAVEGGLYVPETLPSIEPLLADQPELSYQQVAAEVFHHFMQPDFTRTEIEQLVQQAYQGFTSAKITPLEPYIDSWVLELYHGPTFAFKDIALQFLGQVFAQLLSRSGRQVCVLAATSGDTGGAAIAGLTGNERCKTFILYPAGRVSAVQELQMTSAVGDNIFPLELEGSFDDAQAIVKQLFTDGDFGQQVGLTAVNSINWCRIMAQMVYYFFALQQWRSLPANNMQMKPSFVVPTGNFGDVLAGYYAHRCGLPVAHFVVACNENDLLERVYKEGIYCPGLARQTLSPAMDIQVASNFERLLFELADRDSDYVNQKMDALAKHGEYVIEENIMEKFRQLFSVCSISNEQTAEKITSMHQQGIWVDPHTAVGMVAADQVSCVNPICLSTAHPVKFAETMHSLTGEEPELPNSIQQLKQGPIKKFPLRNSVAEVKEFILKHQ